MARIRRGGYVFVTWVGDHAPKHVHVFDDRGLALKWDLEHEVPMTGTAVQRILDLIRELQREGRL